MQPDRHDPPSLTATAQVEAESPWFDGHFPGDPILPGIAQLEMVLRLIAQESGGRRLASLTRVKFKKAVRPGMALDLFATPAGQPNGYSFRISSGGEEVCLGTMVFAGTEENH